MSKMREALQACQTRFLEYAAHHDAKPDPEKAARNREMAELCRAALAAEQEDGWLPIETAPRDGTDFLAACPYERKHHQMVGCFAPNGAFASWPARRVYEPTHWRPLPPSPIQKDGQ